MVFVEYTITDFTKQVASKSPAPGGGRVVALSGAIGAALCQMVANLSSGKKYEAAQPVLDDIKIKSADL
jgi:methenyltetrahydrofolate cyclohydrolase